MIQTKGKKNQERLTEKECVVALNKIMKKHKLKQVSKMTHPELAELLEALAIRLGVADKNGLVFYRDE